MSAVEVGPETRVLIAGGGIAGLETLMALRDLAGDRAELTLVAPQDEFVYRPWLVEEPFGPTPAERRALEPLVAEFGGAFVRQPLAAVRPAEHRVALGDGSEREYDYAVICVGARSMPPFPEVETLAVGPDPVPINDLLEQASEHVSRRLALVVPAGVSWSLPIYEVAMLASSRAGELGLDVEIEIVTPEDSPLIVFGPVPSDAVSKLLASRGIEVRTATRTVRENGRIITIPGGETLDAGAVVALPSLEGPGIEGLPADDAGFLPIDDHARVQGAEDVYAAGDGTNFPIKQGGIGTQQADAAAEDIAARIGADVEPTPFHPVLRGKLLVGEESLNLQADVTGGAGEGVASPDYLWWPPQKVGGRYLAPYLSEGEGQLEVEPPRHPMEVEISLPTEWHRQPMALDPYGRFEPD